MRVFLAVILVSAATVLLLLGLFKDELFPEYSPAHRGLLVARKAGCLQCHVQFDGRGSVNPSKSGRAEQVPNFFTERHEISWIRQWVVDGGDKPGQRSQVNVSSEEDALTMPAFGNRLSEEELRDVVSFVALGQYGQGAGRLDILAEGERIARQHACYTCHGELGQGGVDNPLSLKGYIPGFFGEDFRALTRNGNLQDIREWILEGHSQFFWDRGFAGLYPARFFTERQAIRMPAYRDFLSAQELELLTAHVIELNRLGPLEAEKLVSIRPLPLVREEGLEEAGPAIGQVEESPLTFLAARTVLEQHCLGCHGPDEQKSRFRLDRKEAALQGGELAEITGRHSLKPFRPDESLMIQYVTATAPDPFEEIHPMPPAGNPRLSPSEIEILRRWVEEGLPWPDGIELRPAELSRGHTR